MKKIYTYLLMAVMAMTTFAFASCEVEDREIAYTLEGTWKGNMYITSYYGGRGYDATYSEVTFLKDPGRYSSGTGYWVDYYSDAPWDYVACHIEWTVDWGTIKVYFVEEDTSFSIYDYRLNNDRFYGTIRDNGQTVDFELVHTSSPNWNNYSYWGYDSWYGNYYYSRSIDASDADSTGNAADKKEKAVRTIRPR